jgi:hypothetical protein
MPDLIALPAARPNSYWRASRAPRYSLLFALPLFVFYEALAWLIGGDAPGAVRNGADVIMKQAFIALAGARGSLAFVAVIIGVTIWLVARDVRSHGADLKLPVFVGMFAESMVMALLVGLVAGTITTRLLGAIDTLSIGGAIGPVEALPLPTRVMLSLGAGLYEELLFRVLLVGSLAWIGKRIFKWKPWTAGVVAAVSGAIVFSAFHYIGAFGDAFELRSFVFRAIAGLFFSVLFLLRGFGIAAWAHALYDIAVMS